MSVKIKNEAEEQKGGFLNILLGALGASLLGSLWTGKGEKEQRKEQVKEQLELVWVFDITSSFD